MARAQVRVQDTPQQATVTGERNAPRALGPDVDPVASPALLLQQSVAARLAEPAPTDLWPGAARVAVIVGGGAAAWGLVLSLLSLAV